MATQSESDYNLRTAARLVATRLGLPTTRNLTVEERQTYNTALRAEILKYPQSFTEEVYARAADINTVYDARGHSFPDPLDIIAESAAVTLPSVGKWLFFGALVLGALYVVSNSNAAKAAFSK